MHSLFKHGEYVMKVVVREIVCISYNKNMVHHLWWCLSGWLAKNASLMEQDKHSCYKELLITDALL